MEMKAAQLKACFGDVREISRDEYVREVNQAGEGIWVILLVYKTSYVDHSISIYHCVIGGVPFSDCIYVRSFKVVHHFIF